MSLSQPYLVPRVRASPEHQLPHLRRSSPALSLLSLIPCFTLAQQRLHGPGGALSSLVSLPVENEESMTSILNERQTRFGTRRGPRQWLYRSRSDILLYPALNE